MGLYKKSESNNSEHIKKFNLLLLGWLVLNLVQASFSELLHDEAYYWFYSEHPSFGYFDHPPFIGFIIFLTSHFLDGELGVRLGVVLMGVGILYLVWKTLNPENWNLFLLLIVSNVVVNISSFLAVPDTPVLFFSCLFFYTYQKYLQEDKPLYVFLLIIAMVGMAYSKYVGVFIVFFTILGRIKILKRKSIWIAFIATFLLLIPHFIWQYEHEFATFRYHLLDRGQRPYKIGMFFSFLGSQFLIFGPLTSIVIFIAIFRLKLSNSFEKILALNFWGILLLFLLKSLQGQVEANWTTIILFPLLYLSYTSLKQNPKLQKYFTQLAWINVVLIVIFRLYFVIDFAPSLTQKRNEIHGWPEWANKIDSLADGKDVVFHNSYQKASKYMFYSGNFSHSLGLINYAGKHFDLLDSYEEKIQNKEIVRFHGYGKDTLKVSEKEFLLYDVNKNFTSYNRVKIKLSDNEFLYSKKDSVLQINAELYNPTDSAITFTPFEKMRIHYCLFWYGEIKDCIDAVEKFPVKEIAPRESIPLSLYLKTPPDQKDHWRFRYSISNGLFLGRNSDFKRIKFE